jgi:hypothetical protein
MTSFFRWDVASKLDKFGNIDVPTDSDKAKYDNISYIFSRTEHLDRSMKSPRIRKILTLMSFVL